MDNIIKNTIDPTLDTEKGQGQSGMKRNHSEKITLRERSTISYNNPVTVKD